MLTLDKGHNGLQDYTAGKEISVFFSINKKRARESFTGPFHFAIRLDGLLNGVFSQVRVRFGVLLQFRLVVNVRIRDLERTGLVGDVGFDIADTCDFGQIASDRSGTASSDHVGNFETDKGDSLGIGSSWSLYGLGRLCGIGINRCLRFGRTADRDQHRDGQQ